MDDATLAAITGVVAFRIRQVVVDGPSGSWAGPLVLGPPTVAGDIASWPLLTVRCDEDEATVRGVSLLDVSGERVHVSPLREPMQVRRGDELELVPAIMVSAGKES